MATKKSDRQKVYTKYGCRCAYCGNAIKDISDMQVDHVVPKIREKLNLAKNLDSLDNYNPSCRRCNHYKRANSLETFREYLMTIQSRLRNDYLFKVAEDYGIVGVIPFDGVFYFERCEKEVE